MTGPVSGGPAGAEAPRAALARTGVTDRIPLAAAGSLLAFGGAAIVLAEPRRRARPARAR